MDRTDLVVSELTGERKAEMSSLAAGFVVQMLKRATCAQGETTPFSEGPDRKLFQQSSPT